MDQNTTELEEVRTLFSLLAQTSSTLAKKDIIAKNSNNELFKKALNYLLNPFLITGISTKKIVKDITKKLHTKEFQSFPDLMEYLYANNTGTDEVLANIQWYLSSLNMEMRDFCAAIITKSARIGCDAKSVNKALGEEFIPQWEVQQAYNIEKSPLKENEWFSLTEKLNGVRGTFYNGNIISRQGKEFSGLEHITKEIGRAHV